jgi:hypothetical protein
VKKLQRLEKISQSGISYFKLPTNIFCIVLQSGNFLNSLIRWNFIISKPNEYVVLINKLDITKRAPIFM